MRFRKTYLYFSSILQVQHCFVIILILFEDLPPSSHFPMIGDDMSHGLIKRFAFSPVEMNINCKDTLYTPFPFDNNITNFKFIRWKLKCARMTYTWHAFIHQLETFWMFERCFWIQCLCWIWLSDGTTSVRHATCELGSKFIHYLVY